MKYPALLLFSTLSVFAQPSEQTLTFTSTTNLVIVNVEVADRDGRPIENLRPQDFELLEDGKPQSISVFEYQRLEAPSPFTATPEPVAAPPGVESPPVPATPGRVRYRDRRLLVLFFDFSSMAPAEQIRAQKAALRFLDENMTSADLVSVMSLGNQLQVLQDFTGDRELLADLLRSFRVGEASSLAIEAETGAETAMDMGEAFVADETEFNLFNTDRKLSALESAAKMLAALPEKKALVYFSSGVGKTGVENHSQLRATINAALQANVAFYPIDARGLVAEAPLGDAAQGSQRGARSFSGQAYRQQRDRFNDQQETLFTLAADTGGQAMLDSNDLTSGIVRARDGISSYYILGYYSTNQERDGRFRRLRIRIPSEPKAQLDFRSGYFAPKEFQEFTASEKERQLEEALLLGDPITDLTLALEVNYFRLDPNRYFVPVAVTVPGSEVELARKGGSEEARFDFIGQVRDSRGRLMSTVRDHIRVQLAGADAERLRGRRLQYDTGFTLPPGTYTLKFLARENVTGKIGTFELEFEAPDLRNENSYVRLSSVVLASQREELSSAVGAAERDKKLLARHPLVHEGRKLIPSITRVFRNQHNLYVYFEVYDRSIERRNRSRAPAAARVAFFQDGQKVFESEPLEVTASSTSRSKTAPVEFQIPLSPLKPGRYTCQLTVIDAPDRKFAFWRAPLVVLPGT